MANADSRHGRVEPDAQRRSSAWAGRIEKSKSGSGLTARGWPPKSSLSTGSIAVNRCAPIPVEIERVGIVMRLSRYFLPILKETPKEAEIVSHRLMLRAGMIRQEAAGIYAWLPLGVRVLQKICAIVREEQNRAGAIEVLMPTIQSADLWREIRPLRRLRQGDAAHPRPARARHAVRADQRGDDHRDLPRQRALLQGSAAQSLSHPVEIPRRGEAALRRHALARVPDEGRLFVRPRSGRRAPFLQQDVRRLSCAPSRGSA